VTAEVSDRSKTRFPITEVSDRDRAARILAFPDEFADRRRVSGLAHRLH